MKTNPVEARLTVRHRLGLHARPAATFVQTAAKYRASVQVQNISSGRGPASARSILGVMALGIRQGDEVLLRAEGEDAALALAALANLLDGDENSASETPSPSAEVSDAV